MKQIFSLRALKRTCATVLKQIALILVALALATIFLAVSGYDPLAILRGLWQSLTADIAGTIRWATPLILAGLAICMTYKAEIFNLGVDGQLYMGAVAASAVALNLNTSSSFVGLATVILAAMVAGALFAAIPALLKIFCHADEVVSTLLLNFIALYFVEYMVVGPMRAAGETMKLNASEIFSETFWLPRLSAFQPSAANIGIFFALGGALLVAFLFFKTKAGHEIKIVGANPNLASYSGMRPAKTILLVMMLSGAIGGLIGAIEVTAVQHRLLAGFNPDLGFEGVVVSLLAGNNPIGVIFTGFFFGALRNGGINMERLTDVPSAVTEIVMAIIILTISAKLAFPYVKKWLARYRKQQPAVPEKKEGGREE